MSEMNDAAGHLPGILVSLDVALEREFELAVRESGDLAVRIAFGVLRQREDAEDVAQEAFTRAYQHFAELRERQQFRAWIVRVTWRLAIDRWRGDRRRQTREQTAAAGSHTVDVEDLASQSERAARLWTAIDALPEKLRIVVVLSALQGHDGRDVARLLDIPEGTVKSRLFLARKELARSLTCLANDSAKR
jgi:RNA polymerase sigma-70 factor, ECF subfamily